MRESSTAHGPKEEVREPPKKEENGPPLCRTSLCDAVRYVKIHLNLIWFNSTLFHYLIFSSHHKRESGRPAPPPREWEKSSSTQEEGGEESTSQEEKPVPHQRSVDNHFHRNVAEFVAEQPLDVRKFPSQGQIPNRTVENFFDD